VAAAAVINRNTNFRPWRGFRTCGRQRKRGADKGEERGDGGEAHCVLARARWWGVAAGLADVCDADLHMLPIEALIAMLVTVRTRGETHHCFRRTVSQRDLCFYRKGEQNYQSNDLLGDVGSESPSSRYKLQVDLFGPRLVP
jgi:hypothetical protein